MFRSKNNFLFSFFKQEAGSCRDTSQSSRLFLVSKPSFLAIFVGFLSFVSILTAVYSLIFGWNPYSALYFVAMTTFSNGNIGDLVPQVIQNSDLWELVLRENPDLQNKIVSLQK